MPRVGGSLSGVRRSSKGLLVAKHGFGVAIRRRALA